MREELTLKDIHAASHRIQGDILRTPLLRVPALDAVLNCQVYLKAECLQITGSFKLRGATNALKQLTPQELERGIVTYSSGNHAHAIAYVAYRAGIDATIVMPESVNPAKLSLVRSYGASIVLVDVSQRAETAQRLVQEQGLTLIHPFADHSVKAGQGTCGLEIIEDLPDADAVVVPIGGGGLISGIATAVKSVNPKTQVFGVENSVVPRYTNSLAEGYCHDLSELGETIADATRGVNTDEASFEIISRLVDGIVLVDDATIRQVLPLTLEYGHVLAEPSSNMGPAAALAGSLNVDPDDKVVFVLSGGNCDMRLISTML